MRASRDPYPSHSPAIPPRRPNEEEVAVANEHAEMVSLAAHLGREPTQEEKEAAAEDGDVGRGGLRAELGGVEVGWGRF